MKGLLRKDLYMILRYCRTLLVFCALFMVIGVFSGGENSFFIIYPVLFGGVIPVTLISYDERFHWDRYCDTMPLRRSTVVDARYLMTLLCAGALYLVTMAVQAGVLLPRGGAAVLGQAAVLLPAVGLLPGALMLPIIYRWGVEKGRIAYYVLIAVFTAGGIVFADNWLETKPGAAGSGVGALSIMLTLVLFGASWLLSRRIYARREL